MKVEVGDVIPEWRLDHVGREPMKTVAALLRDPNPLHWDTEAVAAVGLGSIPINQGPSNMAYIVNMLLAWLGDARCVRSLDVRFLSNVYAGDCVRATGEVVEISGTGPLLATCSVRLERGQQAVVQGTAVVEVPV